ncbi:MAG: bile acid:sodium symporter [Chitinophagaceae bacterium]|nr:bile acid:sodium symporter [Chitinophagaceae bacterium]
MHLSAAANTIKSQLGRLGIDGFLVGIIAAILLAYFFPQPGIITEPVSLEQVAGYGISVIFFFYGLRLNFKKLAVELINWRMHIIVQLTTFIVFPLIALAVKPFFNADSILWLGIFYLCTLPSTVSSSVVMVSIADGNVPAAIFNASISTLLGVFITPLWMIPFIEEKAVHTNTSSIILKLVMQVVVPVCCGLLFHKYGSAFAEKYKKRLKLFDQSVILLIIYTSFCHSFYNHSFEAFSIDTLLYLCAGMSALFFIVYYLTKYICKLFKFQQRDSTTVLFCGSKKSLVHGTVMSKVLFSATLPVSIILLPVMIYHSLQLIFVGVIAQRVRKKEIADTSRTK